ncbi:UDP-N-acetylmuramate dehydrogenase [Thiobacter aerophilum]|uniref:UDP-N-acetylenolpyruvoylglucosamine reductase n=1 Tax=Thiobacter aerophilum TaxID=3121275 RepID=A0ABV0EFN7_9BURK
MRGRLLIDEPMARHVSWRAGGRAARAYVPADLADLRAFLAALPATEPVLFVGLGSNLLVRDGGFRGTVILTHGALKEVRMDAGRIYAEAGVAAPKLARFAARHGYQGAEFLAGIPGTVGGALAMNAGCYGAETWQLVDEVLTLDRRGTLRRRNPNDFEIGYRHVALRGAPSGAASEEWFVAAWFTARAGEGAAAQQRIKALLEKRIATQPLNLPNAGSVFRNPPGDFAARLIEACGLKGRRIGGAQVSGKHANFIVNLGQATAADIEALIELVQATVAGETGITLEPEVRIVGEKT